jgi:alpha-tubulin suppressor-like RCC1 family protein
VAPLVAGVTVAPATLTLRPDGTKTLAAAVEPADALQSVVWASDAPSVATVVGDGLTATVTAVAVGTARITATSVGLPATVGACDVTVDTSPVTMAYATVAAGYDHTLAIKVDGSLWAWGRNQFGQLGLGDMGANRLVPTQVGEDKDWVSLSAGEDHTLAIRADGSLWAWGQNDYGQLGLGDNGFDTDRVVPTRVGFLNDWAAVATYYNHSLALKADGSLWAWGWGQDGQLGLGASGAEADRNVPTRVGTDSDWAAVAAGYYHTLAVKSDGSLWAWGENDRGQLGLGNSGSGTGRNVPTKVDAGSDWTTVSASFYHALALKTGGGLYGWGFNSSGQLGLGDNDNRNVPTIVDTLDDLIAVRASNAHTLALKADGSVWAWGNNSYGQLGLSDSGPGTNRNLPNKVGMLGDWTSVATGSFHSMSHKVDGAIWARGRNTSGQLGLGDTPNQNVPTKVGDGWRVPAEQSASGE